MYKSLDGWKISNQSKECACSEGFNAGKNDCTCAVDRFKITLSGKASTQAEYKAACEKTGANFCTTTETYNNKKKTNLKMSDTDIMCWPLKKRIWI